MYHQLDDNIATFKPQPIQIYGKRSKFSNTVLGMKMAAKRKNKSKNTIAEGRFFFLLLKTACS